MDRKGTKVKNRTGLRRELKGKKEQLEIKALFSKHIEFLDEREKELYIQAYQNMEYALNSRRNVGEAKTCVVKRNQCLIGGNSKDDLGLTYQIGRFIEYPEQEVQTMAERLKEMNKKDPKRNKGEVSPVEERAARYFQTGKILAE